ncbi:MAG TPA: hypothetical protein VFW64_08635, partial [Pseudonocardiaceae bacterium]|nr:hypothetical protein [Pseudonocardiaceae bacterium]
LSVGLFATLIGGPGAYAVTPVERHVWGGYYEQGSLIWRSRWITTSGIVECREALGFPGDPHRVVILRRIIAVRGDARVRVTLHPAAGVAGDGTGSGGPSSHGETCCSWFVAPWMRYHFGG